MKLFANFKNFSKFDNVSVLMFYLLNIYTISDSEGLL